MLYMLTENLQPSFASLAEHVWAGARHQPEDLQQEQRTAALCKGAEQAAGKAEEEAESSGTQPALLRPGHLLCVSWNSWLSEKSS